MNQAEQVSAAVAPPSQPLSVVGSRYFLSWLAEEQVSLAFTTYQAGKLFLIGRKPDNTISVFERTFPHCMGLWAAPHGRSAWLATRYQVWRFSATTMQGGPTGSSERAVWSDRGYDTVYTPRVGYTTGHLDIHDLAVDANGRVLFVNTAFGCLATTSEDANFQPLWQPSFLSALVPEDRCHLNGLAMREGRAAYVTAVADSDVADGWRDRRRDGGCIVDVTSNEIVLRGLSMPHSPRWHHDKLWVLNSGCGEFGFVDLDRGRFEPIAFCPGYLRGLTFVGDYAVVTLSRPRHDSFHGLPLAEALAAKGAQPQCGLQVIDLKTGEIAHWLRVEGSLISELYDVVPLPGVRQPMALGFQTNEIERFLLIDELGDIGNYK